MGQEPVEDAQIGELVRFYSHIDLDEHVHEAAQAAIQDSLNALDGEDEQEDLITDAESTASNINNEGFESQLRYLIEQNGFEETLRVLRDDDSTETPAGALLRKLVVFFDDTGLTTDQLGARPLLKQAKKLLGL